MNRGLLFCMIYSYMSSILSQLFFFCSLWINRLKRLLKLVCLFSYFAFDPINRFFSRETIKLIIYLIE